MKKMILSLMSLAIICVLLLQACSKDDLTIAIQTVTLSANTLTMKPGDLQKLTVTIAPTKANVESTDWSSSDNNVATVDADGNISAVNEGNANITVLVNKAQTAVCVVTVKKDIVVMNDVKGDVEGIWEKNAIVNVTGQIRVAEGKTLTIQEGAQIIFSTTALDESNTKIEFLVDGNLYCYGSNTNKIRFTVPETERTTANKYTRLWGGIIGSTKCPAMVLDNVIVEYTGAITTKSSPSVVNGLFKADGGEGMVAFNTNNVDGKYVITNSTFRYTGEDALYLMGGNCIVANNIFYAVGATGGEAINVKAGVALDATRNLIYSPNTNGFKLSGSGVSATRPIKTINAYNNTIINAGWRRDGLKGGSIWAEKGVIANVFNNLLVNCLFGIKNSSASLADEQSVFNYNFLASGIQKSSLTIHQAANQTAYDGFKTGVVDVVYGTNDKAGQAVGDNDPKFVNFPFNTNPLVNDELDSSWDFTLTDGPALTGATTTRTVLFSSTGIVINGKTYTSALPASYFGAFNKK